MKFSHSIQFNAVPDWASKYIAYSNLKKLIYTLEKKVNEAATAQRDDEERTSLIRDETDPDPIFRRALDNELDKIAEFYQLKELELYGELEELIKDKDTYLKTQVEELGNSTELDGSQLLNKRRITLSTNIPAATSPTSLSPTNGKRTGGAGASVAFQSDSDSENSEDELISSTSGGRRRKRASTVGTIGSNDLLSSKPRHRNSVVYDEFNEGLLTDLYDQRITLKKRTINLYVSMVELKSFIQLNKTGFTKALKKYDKILNRNLRDKYITGSVLPAYLFQESTVKNLGNGINSVEEVYAQLITNEDVEAAKKELRLYLREHVVWERNTVWREMIGIERKAQAANLGVRRTLLGADVPDERMRRQGDEAEPEKTELRTPLGTVTCPRWLISSNFFVLVISIAVFLALLVAPIFHSAEQRGCFAILVFASILWATEVIPLFVTSLLIPFLAVVLRVVREDTKPHSRLDAKDAAKYIFAAMWTPVIMLLLGGFTIAAALSKYHIAKMIATKVLSAAGTRPQTVLLTNMFVAMVASMWISNVAAPVLCYSIIQPMLRNLSPESNMSKALILGIALASNVGGMASPIASPQNIIALQNMKPEPSWGEWFVISLPVSILSILAIWIILLVTFKPGRGTNIVPIRPMKDPFTGVQWFISIVTVATIILWCFAHRLEAQFGDMGVVAIIPIIMFFGTGILTKEDFNNFLWTIIILAAGGLSLGKAVNSSGLLHTIALNIQHATHEMSLYGVVVTFAALILVIATFISHTVAAAIILPVVAQVGAQMEDPHPRVLVMVSALMCSAAMGLPTSGFPNMTAIMMEDNQTGQRYLRVKHFISRGIPSSIATFAVVVTVGFGLSRLVGF
ncbi:low-affinity phosphate transporter [Orbilia ellipsospora]|uniref:Low-affinity phosphate transporter n=1 Tax=Orbilia ellipsospora TaxID=2528407 RepID=A0AAV9X4K3_9PEZI